jgi:hypothetical protein
VHIGSVPHGLKIEFQCEEWVKSSLLLWESVYRIVPNPFRPNDSLMVREAEQSELNKNITLELENSAFSAVPQRRRTYAKLKYEACAEL